MSCFLCLIGKDGSLSLRLRVAICSDHRHRAILRDHSCLALSTGVGACAATAMWSVLSVSLTFSHMSGAFSLCARLTRSATLASSLSVSLFQRAERSIAYSVLQQRLC